MTSPAPIVAMPPSFFQSCAPFRARAAKQRSAVLVSADRAVRTVLADELRGMRWAVEEADSAAEMFALLEQGGAAFCFIDGWLPDLEVRECVRELLLLFPETEVLPIDGTDVGAPAAKSALRTEALYALRKMQGRLDEPAENTAAIAQGAAVHPIENAPAALKLEEARLPEPAPAEAFSAASPDTLLPEFIGTAPELLEVSRRIRLVAHRKTPVLVHGATGTGKELVARALHRLSGRAGAKFIAINCAAIPEALVEAELFGHARGAFTGASGNRVGRIEAAAGGTLFLDEIGELPLLVQSKLLRFLESGEIQRIGENEPVRVDVRVVAATHRKLGAMAREGTFRLDLLQRLSVFLIQTPTLAGRTADIDALLDHGLRALGAEEAPKRLSALARARFHTHSWPGNVRELQHTLERAWILAGASAVIGAECMDFGEALY